MTVQPSGVRRINFDHYPTSKKCITQRQRQTFLPADSLRYFGFYSSRIHEQEKMTTKSRTSICIGFCFSVWLVLLSISLEVALVNAPQQDGWNLQFNIRVQNRISLESPLIKACQKGDIPLIRQILKEGRGGINDRTICLGKTPLMVRFA